MSGSSTASPEGRNRTPPVWRRRFSRSWEDVVGTLEVVPGANGIFDVHVDGELVFTKSMLGRYPDPDDVMPLLRAKLDT